MLVAVVAPLVKFNKPGCSTFADVVNTPVMLDVVLAAGFRLKVNPEVEDADDEVGANPCFKFTAPNKLGVVVEASVDRIGLGAGLLCALVLVGAVTLLKIVGAKEAGGLVLDENAPKPVADG